jgi:sec-independent protein translocase protein TatB
MLKKAGSWIGSAKRYINNIQNEVADLDLDNIDTEKHKTKDKDKYNDKI